MQPEIKKHLFDISQAVANLEAFMRDKNRSDYLNDLLLQSAVERQFLIVGEAMVRPW